MAARFRRMTAREVEALLRRYGFELVSQRGSHRKWRHAETGRQVIVSEPTTAAQRCPWQAAPLGYAPRNPDRSRNPRHRVVGIDGAPAQCATRGVRT
jgi:predicted RNA binding protein YcfA (HicA-like mRNA interferase family)